MREEILLGMHIKDVLIEESYAFVENDKVFLLSPVGTSIIITLDLYKELKEGTCPDALLFKLIQRGFAKVTGAPETIIPDTKVNPNFFMITMTNKCNLRCKYCFHQFLPDKESVISEEMLGKILDYIIKYAVDHNTPKLMIQAWGGEPMLCMDRIEQIYDTLSKTDLEFKICIETNGTLITPETAKKLHDMKVGVGISIDGMEKIQNAQRPLAGGQGSFDLVTRGLKCLQETEGEDYGSITVVTKEVLNNLEENLDFFVSKDMKRVKFNVARVSEEQKLGLELDEVDEFVSRLVNKIVDLNENGNCITEGNVVDRLKNLLFRPESNICNSHGCQGGKKMISFDAKGNIYPCEMTDYPEVCLGNVEDNKDLEEIITGNLGKGYFKEKDLTDCTGCPFLYFCGGGCTTAIIYKKGEVSGVDDYGCALNKKMYRELISIILNKPELVDKLLAGGK